ncbi:MAG: MarR family transcriptional regulator [Deltaproteobacteria bacterium]|nr:MarR family transcriptional regulator [Deltaproteobacteria bacterium]
MPTDDRFIYMVSMAQHTLRTYLNSLFSKEGMKITPPQATLLFLLQERDGRIMSELGQVIGVDNSAITGLVDRLEKAGLVIRKLNPEDRRSLLIYITPGGRKEAKKAEAIIRRVNESIKAGFSARELDTFKKILNSFFEMFRSR